MDNVNYDNVKKRVKMFIHEFFMTQEIAYKFKKNTEVQVQCGLIYVFKNIVNTKICKVC